MKKIKNFLKKVLTKAKNGFIMIELNICKERFFS